MKAHDVLIKVYGARDTIYVSHATEEHAKNLLDKVEIAIGHKSALTLGTTVLNGAYIISARMRG